MFIDDIEWVAAAGDHAELHRAGRCHLLRETMAPSNRNSVARSFFAFIARGSCVRDVSGCRRKGARWRGAPHKPRRLLIP